MAVLRKNITGSDWASYPSFHGSTMLSLRAAHGMTRGRQTRENRHPTLAGLWTASSLVVVAYHGAGLEPAPRAFVSDASGGGYALLEISTSAGEVLDLTCFRERWRFRSIPKPATIPSAEARASQSASHNTVAPVF